MNPLSNKTREELLAFALTGCDDGALVPDLLEVLSETLFVVHVALGAGENTPSEDLSIARTVFRCVTLAQATRQLARRDRAEGDA